MKFIEDHYYHIYNQGNNKSRIFFKEENYYYFTDKLKKFILPHADMLAHCLMPNHFHLLIRLNDLTIEGRNFNEQIGILLRTYTRAINVQEKRTGSLFRNGTKSKALFFWDDLNCSEDNYLKTCFEYIHQNPVKAGLVFKEEDWKYSSANIYKKKLKSNWINTELAKEIGLV